MPLWRGNKSAVWIGDVLPHCVLAMRRNIFAGLSRNLGQVQTTDTVRLERGVSECLARQQLVGWWFSGSPAALPSALSLAAWNGCLSKEEASVEGRGAALHGEFEEPSKQRAADICSQETE